MTQKRKSTKLKKEEVEPDPRRIVQETITASLVLLRKRSTDRMKNRVRGSSKEAGTSNGYDS